MWTPFLYAGVSLITCAASESSYDIMIAAMSLLLMR